MKNNSPKPCAKAPSPRRNARPAPWKRAPPDAPTGFRSIVFQSLLADLATLARNTIVTAIAPNRPFTVLTRPTPIQQKAFDLLNGLRFAKEGSSG